jgi:hypothetical protein
MKGYTILSILFMTFFLPSLDAQQTPHPAKEMNSVTPGKFMVEPTTLICAGFEWSIQGDDNRNSSVEVSYRKKGSAEWKKGLPLLRLKGERVVHKAVEIDFTAPNMFSGSIFDLEPGATYECRFILKDPDGVKGNGVKTVMVTTRPEPKAFEGGRIFHVYPLLKDPNRTLPAPVSWKPITDPGEGSGTAPRYSPET